MLAAQNRILGTRTLTTHGCADERSDNRTAVGRPERRCPSIIPLLAAILFPAVAWAQLPSAGALVLWPNCASPGDTVWVKTGNWPDFGGAYQVLLMDLCDSEDGTQWYGPDGHQTKAILPAVIDASASAGTHNWAVYPITCDDAAFENCHWIPPIGAWTYCQSAQLMITSDTGNPIVATTADALWGSQYGTPDTLGGLHITFDPNLFCNTSPCDKIRLIQVVKPQAKRNGPAEYTPFAQMAGSQILHWHIIDSLAVNGWSVDFFADTFNADGSSNHDGECDPYINGEDDTDLQERLKGRAGVGSMGAIVDSAFYSDHPGGGGDALYDHFGISSKVFDFEVNAFCSDGDNQGEWIGRMTWRWEKPRGQRSIATILSVEPKAKPTAAFMAALKSFCSAKGFAFPEPMPPAQGGIACQGESCLPQSPQRLTTPGRAWSGGSRGQ